MLQSIKRELNDEYSFGEISDKARACTEFKAIVDVNDSMFLAPKSMIEATALGNILAQMMSQGVIKTVDDARDAIKNSFEIKKITV